VIEAASAIERALVKIGHDKLRNVWGVKTMQGLDMTANDNNAHNNILLITHGWRGLSILMEMLIHTVCEEICT